MANKINNFYDSLGFSIVYAREKKGISQKCLAEKIGIQPSALSNYERGYRAPSIETLTKISQALDVPLDSLTEDLKTGDDIKEFYKYDINNEFFENLVYMDERLHYAPMYSLNDTGEKNIDCAVYFEDGYIPVNGAYLITFKEMEEISKFIAEYFKFKLYALVQANPHRFKEGIDIDKAKAQAEDETIHDRLQE